MKTRGSRVDVALVNVSAANLSLSMNGSALQNAVSVRVARQTLDNAQTQGDALVAMIDSAGPKRAPISARPIPGETGRGLDVTG